MRSVVDRLQRVIVLGVAALALGTPVTAQVDSTLAQEGIYNRPFIGSVSSTSIGGYVEGNTNRTVGSLTPSERAGSAAFQVWP